MRQDVGTPTVPQTAWSRRASLWVIEMVVTTLERIHRMWNSAAPLFFQCSPVPRGSPQTHLNFFVTMTCEPRIVGLSLGVDKDVDIFYGVMVVAPLSLSFSRRVLLQNLGAVVLTQRGVNPLVPDRSIQMF